MLLKQQKQAVISTHHISVSIRIQDGGGMWQHRSLGSIAEGSPSRGHGWSLSIAFSESSWVTSMLLIYEPYFK